MSPGGKRKKIEQVDGLFNEDMSDAGQQQAALQRPPAGCGATWPVSDVGAVVLR